MRDPIHKQTRLHNYLPTLTIGHQTPLSTNTHTHTNSHQSHPTNYTHKHRLELEEGERVRVNLRPRVDEFLLRLADDFDCVAFTAATEVCAVQGSLR